MSDPRTRAFEQVVNRLQAEIDKHPDLAPFRQPDRNDETDPLAWLDAVADWLEARQPAATTVHRRYMELNHMAAQQRAEES